MARFPYAAKALATQVRERYGRSADSEVGLSTMEAAGDPDGLGVVRAVKFDKTSSKWLTPLLKEAKDPRIVDLETKGGRLIVTFTHRVIADSQARFPLEAAQTVAEAESADDE